MKKELPNGMVVPVELACSNPGAFKGALHVILTARSWTEGVSRNLMVGGDNCSRATIVGAVLAAAFGVPDVYLERLDAGLRAEIENPGESSSVSSQNAGRAERKSELF